jgi:hypothetical protein
MVEAGSNAYILVPWLAAAARVALGAALWARASKNVKKLQNQMCE